ncbi:hypothetical protein B0O80DRAFT_451175 [Mortierella sp. GBAus27b]|nr:hypothetical protein B0O80DRAFT_451175 [Mortierella sp. GBAus27b]
MPNYVSLTESQRRKIAVFITESQQQAQLLQQQQQQQQAANNGDDSVIASSSLAGSPGGPTVPITGTNSISCKEIVQFCKTRFGLTISLSTASRLRSTAAERLSTELLNPSAKRHRSVKFPEFEKALVQELRALEQEQLQMQQEQDRLSPDSTTGGPFDQTPLPPVMMLTSEAAITQVAKGIAERMGIPVTELGLTSGWYHGFKRRHGIKHRQFKGRPSGSPASGGVGVPTLGSIGGPGAGGSVNMMETGDGSDGPDGADGDEEMDDAGPDSGDAVESKGSGTKRAAGRTLKPPRKRALATSFSADASPGIDPAPGPLLNLCSTTTVEGSATTDAGSSSTTGPLLNISNIVLTPKETPPASSLSRRPEVKRVTAATANDALDVISEYLLQNGQIGATKLPLVKELRKFLLAQTEIENGTASSRTSGIMLGVGVSSLSSGQSSPGRMHAEVEEEKT